jgi:hypothetical protein
VHGGHAGCTPLTAPVYLSDSFRGIDRGADVEGLSGVRVNDTGSSIIQNFGLLAVKANMRGKKLKKGALNPINFWTVSQLSARRSCTRRRRHGRSRLRVHRHQHPGGAMRVYSDPDCPTDEGRGFDPAAHYLKHLNELPHIVRDDGKPSIRSTGTDGVEIRAAAGSTTSRPTPPRTASSRSEPTPPPTKDNEHD